MVSPIHVELLPPARKHCCSSRLQAGLAAEIAVHLLGFPGLAPRICCGLGVGGQPSALGSTEGRHGFGTPRAAGAWLGAGRSGGSTGEGRGRRPGMGLEAFFLHRMKRDLVACQNRALRVRNVNGLQKSICRLGKVIPSLCSAVAFFFLKLKLFPDGVGFVCRWQ